MSLRVIRYIGGQAPQSLDVCFAPRADLRFGSASAVIRLASTRPSLRRSAGEGRRLRGLHAEGFASWRTWGASWSGRTARATPKPPDARPPGAPADRHALQYPSMHQD